jgi:hypothetical protein
MILNAYAVLDAFVSLLRLPFGLLVLGLGLAAWRASRRPAGPEERRLLEDRNYLLGLVAVLLLALNLGSWPLLYLLLQSYVPQWEGVMCIYGVTRIGSGSTSISRFLPGLLAALQALKPLVVFASGAWFVLYLLNRRTDTGPLLGRTLLVLIVFGALTVADAGCELAYLVIPKKEVSYSGGCCAGAFDDAAAGPWGALTAAVGGPGARPWLYTAYYASNLLMAAALFVWARRSGSGAGLVPLLAGAVVALAASAVFLVEVASPILLHLPQHHCPYDLVEAAPEALIAVALFAAATFSVGWACVAGWFARCPQTAPFLGPAVGRLLSLACWCYVGSLLVMSIDLAAKG